MIPIETQIFRLILSRCNKIAVIGGK